MLEIKQIIHFCKYNVGINKIGFLQRSKSMKWYRFTWEDGSVTISRGYNKEELEKMTRDHGKLMSTVRI